MEWSEPFVEEVVKTIKTPYWKDKVVIESNVRDVTEEDWVSQRENDTHLIVQDKFDGLCYTNRRCAICHKDLGTV